MLTKNKLVDPQVSVGRDSDTPELPALGAEFPARAEFPPLDTGVSAPPRVKINISIFKMRLNRTLMIKTLLDIKTTTRTMAQSKWLPILIL